MIVTTPHAFANESACINALFDEGLDILHLRKPDMNEWQMSEWLSKINSRYYSRIMIHSHYQLLNRFGLKGIHFTERSKHLLPDYLSVKCIKSRPLHDLMEWDEVPPSIDYVLLSPLFPSISKEGYAKAWDFEALKSALAQKRSFRVVALGGITLANVKEVKAMGFDDYALLGSIWEPATSGCTIDQLVTIYKTFKREA